MNRMLFRPVHELINYKKNGFALLSATIMLGIITASASVLVSYALTTRNAAKFLEADYDALQIAEAGIQKALYCLKATSDAGCGGTFGENHTGQADVPFGNGTFTTAILASGSQKLITSTGINAMNRIASVEVLVTTDTAPEKGASFNYAVQVGNEGLDIENNAEVNNGPIRSNSDVDCGGQADIEQSVFVSKERGYIYNCTIGGDAHADQVKSSDITGDVYYDVDPIDVSGTSFGGANYPNSPTPQEIVLPDLDLAQWRQAAENGGTISGDYEPTNGESLGPKKIEGGLIVGNGVHITITGPIWVTGDVFTDNNSSMTLDSSFGMNSTVILADHHPDSVSDGGQILLENGSTISGSGTDGSYILFVSTNDSLDENEPAVEVKNNASGAIILALNGLAYFWNNSNVAAIAGESVVMRQNAVLNYDDAGLMPSDATFWTGETGDWRFREHSWHRL